MAKNILVAGLVMLAAASAQASYLLWQVNAGDLSTAISDYNAKWNPSTTLTQENISGARLVQVTADGKSVVGAVAKSDFGTQQQVEIDLGAASGDAYSYYIEVISLASGLPYSQVAVSNDHLTYNELVTQNAVYTGSELSVPQLVAWSGGGFAAAPEPTSGLLLMFGLGLLGLKRKHV